MHKLYHILERSNKESRCKILEFAPSFQKKKRSSSLIAFNAKPDATISDTVISNLQLELDVWYWFQIRCKLNWSQHAGKLSILSLNGSPTTFKMR